MPHISPHILWGALLLSLLLGVSPPVFLAMPMPHQRRSSWPYQSCGMMCLLPASPPCPGLLHGWPVEACPTHSMVIPAALGHGTSRSRTASGCSCRFVVQHEDVSPIQRSAVDDRLRDRTWLCEDSQALTWLNNLHVQSGLHPTNSEQRLS